MDQLSGLAFSTCRCVLSLHFTGVLLPSSVLATELHATHVLPEPQACPGSHRPVLGATGLPCSCRAGTETEGPPDKRTVCYFRRRTEYSDAHYPLSLCHLITKLLTAYDLKAVPEVPNFDVRNDSTVPAVHQVHILVSKLLAKGFWLPEFRLELFMDP